MKNINKKILIGLITILITIWAVSAYYPWFWIAWNGIKWIGHSETWKARFIYMTWSDGIPVYYDTFINKKWATNKVWSLTTTEDFSDNPATEWQAVLQWAVNTDNATYPEPIWNWTQYIYGAGRTSAHYPAFKYCSDMWAWWRLPTKNELTSLFTIVMPSWMSYYTALPAISTYNYWSSTVNRNSTTDAWRSYFDYGHMSNGFKTNTNRVICIHD